MRGVRGGVCSARAPYHGSPIVKNRYRRRCHIGDVPKKTKPKIRPMTSAFLYVVSNETPSHLIFDSLGS